MRRPENEWHNQEKLLHCETESVSAQTGLFVDSLLRSNKGNENGGNSVRKGGKLSFSKLIVKKLFLEI